MYRTMKTSVLLSLISALLVAGRPQGQAPVPLDAEGESTTPLNPTPALNPNSTTQSGSLSGGAANEPVNETTIPPVYCFGSNAEPNPLNTKACEYLLDVRLPTVLDLQKPGNWSVGQQWHWDLGNDSPGYKAGDCNLEFHSTGEVGPTGQKDREIYPEDFVDQARKYILPKCGGSGGRGGSQALIWPRGFFVRLSTQTATQSTQGTTTV